MRRLAVIPSSPKWGRRFVLSFHAMVLVVEFAAPPQTGTEVAKLKSILEATGNELPTTASLNRINPQPFLPFTLDPWELEFLYGAYIAHGYLPFEGSRAETRQLATWLEARRSFYALSDREAADIAKEWDLLPKRPTEPFPMAISA